jgi:hypothetical protein
VCRVSICSICRPHAPGTLLAGAGIIRPPPARPWLSPPHPAHPTGAEIGVASTKAYTSQIVAITMMALCLSEDCISKRPRRDEIIDNLCNLGDVVRQVCGP